MASGRASENARRHKNDIRGNLARDSNKLCRNGCEDAPPNRVLIISRRTRAAAVARRCCRLAELGSVVELSSCKCVLLAKSGTQRRQSGWSSGMVAWCAETRHKRAYTERDSFVELENGGGDGGVRVGEDGEQ